MVSARISSHNPLNLVVVPRDMSSSVTVAAPAAGVGRDAGEGSASFTARTLTRTSVLAQHRGMDGSAVALVGWKAP